VSGKGISELQYAMAEEVEKVRYALLKEPFKADTV
jgi:hypothetical protein